MALKFLSSHTPGGTGSSKDVKVFDIRLDNDYIVFRGGEEESASVSLAGSLVLCLADALSIHHIKLTLSGIAHMTYLATSTSSMSGRRTAVKEKTFYEHSWTFKEAAKGKSETLPRDNYQWPFQVTLDGTLPESVEGSKEAWVVYRLKAEICRKRGKDIVVRKPVRLVRTLGATALELSHAMSVENVWPNKIEYAISTPSKAVVFGTFLQLDFKLVPLLKGLVIGNISTQLKEEQEFMIDPDWGTPAIAGAVIRDDRVIAYDNYQLQSEDEQIIDEEAEGFQFSRYLELPKTLNKCLQDCNVQGIKIRHKIKFNVQLHNPDGHVSELRANLPVALYISPNLPINENNDLVDQTPQAGRAAIQNDLAHAAPPVYGQHTLDQLYSDVDPSGYRTPGRALSSPTTPYTHSRNISTENLASLDAITNGPLPVSASALQYRLQNLRVSDRMVAHSPPQDDAEQPRSGDLSRRGSDGNQHGDYFSSSNGVHDASDTNHSRTSPGNHGQGGNSNHSSHSNSAPLSRRGSGDNSQHATPGVQSPPLLINHFEDLVKVPSYSTAMKTPAPRGQDDILPTYGAVLTSDRPITLAQPPSAHVHTSRSGGWSADNVNAVTTAGSTSQTRLGNMAGAQRRPLAGRG